MDDLEQAAAEWGLEGEPLTFTYTNWRGETAIRKATPCSIEWAATEWHPEPGWLMRAFDHDKQAERDFALADCAFTDPAPVWAAYEAAAEAVQSKINEVSARQYQFFQAGRDEEGYRAHAAHVHLCTSLSDIRALMQSDPNALAARDRALAEAERRGMEKALLMVEARQQLIRMQATPQAIIAALDALPDAIRAEAEKP